MKKIILFLSLVCFLKPAFVSAQYSNASLNGPWLCTGGPNGAAYILFDGAGNVTQLGTASDSLSPVGTYSVTGAGVISGSVNLIPATLTISGQMINDSSAAMSVTCFGSVNAYKVLNRGILSGKWRGLIYDTSAHASRTVQLTVDSTGLITAATGITGLLTGHIFMGRDTFAGFITTTDDSCAFKSIQIRGIQVGDSLKGAGNMGPYNSSCASYCYLGFGQLSTGITAISNIDFSVYPNPFTERIEISLNSSGNNIQVDLYDLYGRKVLSRSLGHDPALSIDASMLSTGMYMLTLTDSYGTSSTKRVIKK